MGTVRGNPDTGCSLNDGQSSRCPTAGHPRGGSHLTRWRVGDKDRAQKCTCLFHGLEKNQMRRQTTFFFKFTEWMGQFGLQNAVRLRIKDHNYGITIVSPPKNSCF